MCLSPFCRNLYLHLLRATVCVAACHVGSWKNWAKPKLGKGQAGPASLFSWSHTRSEQNSDLVLFRGGV